MCNQDRSNQDRCNQVQLHLPQLQLNQRQLQLNQLHQLAVALRPSSTYVKAQTIPGSKMNRFRYNANCRSHEE